MPKKIERGDSLVSPGLVCYAEKQVKPFWFSSLDQIVHFGAIIFCRTFVELFWSVRVDRKKSHYNSRVSLHEAPTKKLVVIEEVSIIHEELWATIDLILQMVKEKDLPFGGVLIIANGDCCQMPSVTGTDKFQSSRLLFNFNFHFLIELVRMRD